MSNSIVKTSMMLTANASQASAEVTKYANDARKAAKESQAAFDGMTSYVKMEKLPDIGAKIDHTLIDKASDSAMHLTKHLLTAGVAALGISSAFTMIESAIESAIHAEQLHMNFELLLGSVQKTDLLLGNLKETATKLNVRFTMLEEAGVQMLKYGFNENDIAPALEIITNYGSALGDVKGTLESVVHTMGVLRDKPVVDAKTMKPLMELGLHPYETLAKQLGKSKEEVKEMLSDGLIDVPTMMKAMFEEMDKIGAGGAGKMARTTWGKIDKAKLFIAGKAKAFGQGILGSAGVMADLLTLNFHEEAPVESEVHAEPSGLTQKMDAVKNALSPATIALNKFKEETREMMAAFGKTDLEKKLSALQKVGVDAKGMAEAQEITKQVEAQKEQAKLMEEGKRLAIELADPYETLTAEIAKLDEMLYKGVIKIELYDRALTRAQDAFAKTDVVAAYLNKTMTELHEHMLSSQFSKGELLIQKLIGAGASDGEIMIAEEMERQAEEAKKINDLKKEAERLNVSELTGLAKYRAEMEHIAQLRQNGLTDDVANSMTTKAKQNYLKEQSAMDAKLHSPGLALAGSQEAYKVMVNSTRGDSGDKQLSELNKIAAETQGSKKANEKVADTLPKTETAIVKALDGVTSAIKQSSMQVAMIRSF